MSTKPVKAPGLDHPITITANGNRIVVTVDKHVVADTRNSLTLQEAAYAPVQYIPRADVNISRLIPSQHTTYCPYKGDCSYFSIVADGGKRENAVWTYENPYPAVSSIREYVAFYPERVDSIQETAE